MLKNKIALACLMALPLSLSMANYKVILPTNTVKYYIEEWEEFFKYSEWSDINSPYDCSDSYYAVDSVYFKDINCSQDQERSYDKWEKEINTGKERFISSGGTENQTIPTKETLEVASVKVSPVSGDYTVQEGSAGTNNSIQLKVSLNKSFPDQSFTFYYNTQDGTTSSVLDKAENLVYDEFGNPFISVVDNVNGGRLIFDAGFPKYYNGNWNGATTFDGMRQQFKFMHNIVKWIGNTHKSRGKVLIYGDAIEDANYSVHENASSDFNLSIPSTISIAGFTPVIKEASHPDFNGSKSANRKVDMTLEEMNNYSAIIVMSSGGWESLTDEAANNFTTYVNNGGGVYIITDHSYFQPTGNQILRKFGSEFYGTIDRTGSNAAYKLSTIWSRLDGTGYGEGHPLWTGLTETSSIPAGGSEGNVRLLTPTVDIVATSGSITFAPGETEKIVTLQVVGDNVKEENETFKFMVTAKDNGYADEDNNAQIITVIDDD